MTQSYTNSLQNDNEDRQRGPHKKDSRTTVMGLRGGNEKKIYRSVTYPIFTFVFYREIYFRPLSVRQNDKREQIQIGNIFFDPR